MQIVSNPYQKNNLGQILTSKNSVKTLRSVYIYGYQGSEMDNELKGNGNSYDFGARMLDPRIGRWFTIDGYASSYPHQSPYGFVGNSPILNQEIDGNYYDVNELSRSAKTKVKRAFQKQLGDKGSLKLGVIDGERIEFEHKLRARIWLSLHKNSENAALVQEVLSDQKMLTVKENSVSQGVPVTVTNSGQTTVTSVPASTPSLDDGYQVNPNPTTVTTTTPSTTTSATMPIEADVNVKDRVLTLNTADISSSESKKPRNVNDVFNEVVQQGTKLIQELSNTPTLPTGGVTNLNLNNHIKVTDNNTYHEKQSKAKQTP